MSERAPKRRTRLEGWLWGTLLAGSLAAGIAAFVDWIARGDADPAPEPLTLDQPGMPFGPDPAPEPAPLPPDFVPDLPAVPTLAPGARPSAATSTSETDDDDARLAQLAAEMRLVQEARAMIERDPAVSLSLLDQHRQRFPRGALREEREAYAIEALVALGHEDEVERRYVEFREDFPSSTFTARLERLVR